MMTMTTYLVPILGRLALVGGLSLSTGFCASREPESIEQLQRMVSSLSLSQFGTGGVGAPASSAIPDGIAEEAALTQRISTAKERAAQAKAQRTQLQQQLEEATRAQREKKAQLDEAKRRETRLANDLKWKKQELETAQHALDECAVVNYNDGDMTYTVIPTRRFLIGRGRRVFESVEEAKGLMDYVIENRRSPLENSLRENPNDPNLSPDKIKRLVNSEVYETVFQNYEPVLYKDFISSMAWRRVLRWTGSRYVYTEIQYKNEIQKGDLTAHVCDYAYNPIIKVGITW